MSCQWERYRGRRRGEAQNDKQNRTESKHRCWHEETEAEAGRNFFYPMINRLSEHSAPFQQNKYLQIHLTDIVNRGSLAYMSPLLLVPPAYTGVQPEWHVDRVRLQASSGQAKGAKQLDLCPGHQLRSCREHALVSPCCLNANLDIYYYWCLRCKGILSPVCRQLVTAGPPLCQM